MTRPHFHEELEKMELRLLTLGELSGNAVQRAVEAVMQHDDDAAEAVVVGDDEIDAIYFELDQGMLPLLALQAPVAADLRLVSVIMHSSLHLERIGDQAVNVAKMYQVTGDLPGNPTIVQQIGEMGHIVVEISLMVQRRPDYDALEAASQSYRVLARAFDDAGIARQSHQEVARISHVGDPRTRRCTAVHRVDGRLVWDVAP